MGDNIYTLSVPGKKNRTNGAKMKKHSALTEKNLPEVKI
jgi:hypothetical protein